jgi:hypothetical protein
MRARWLMVWMGLLVVLGAAPLAANSMSADQVAAWRADLASFERELRNRHIDPFHRLSEAEFTHRLQVLRERLPSLDEDGILRELMCLTAAVGDGHTQVNYWGRAHRHLPLRWRWFADGLRVVKVAPAYGHLLGARLARIGGLTEAALAAALRGCLPSVENESSWWAAFASAAAVAEVLAGAGATVADTGVQVQLQLVSGEFTQLELPWQPAGDSPWQEPPWRSYGFAPVPPSVPGLAVYHNATSATAYLQFDGYPPYDQALRFAKSLRKALDKRAVRRLVIDLRNNGGGDFFVGLVVAHGLVLLDQLDWRRGVYVLIGRHTYSAAMSNAAQYRQILNARLVGEATGANPVGYQDAESFHLPNAGWRVMVSKRRYRFTDTATHGLLPDAPVAWPAQPYLAGRDLPLEWILADIATSVRE